MPIEGFTVSLIIRVLGGEALLGWQATVAYPWYDPAANKQYFPYKTMAMLAGFITMLTVSYLTHRLMATGSLHPKWLRRINNRVKDVAEEKEEVEIGDGQNNFSYSNSDNAIPEKMSKEDESYRNPMAEATSL